MKKVGIITFHRAINYGAVLQAFALQKTLENLNVEVEIIDYQNTALNKSNSIIRKPKIYKKTKYKKLKEWYIKYKNIKNQKEWEIKHSNFTRFRNKNLKLSEKNIEQKKDNKSINYDIVICGSDQVWNPEITNGLDKIYFSDIKSSSIKASYAASVGDLRVLNGHEKDFIEKINKMDYVSTREKDLSEFIKSKTNKKAVQVLDPTLLLQAKNYIELVKEPKNIPDNYLLIYKMQNNKDLYKTAEKIAKELNLKIIEIGFKTNKNITFIESASPGEFLWYFKNAKYIITNSFHGTAFSIIFQKNFVTFPHKSVGQRMIDFLNSIDLTERLLYSYNEYDKRVLEEINYTHPLELLEIRKKKSLKYIEEVVQTDAKIIGK